jgi:hypothetical protein
MIRVRSTVKSTVESVDGIDYESLIVARAVMNCLLFV